MVWISKLFGNGVPGAVIVMAILIAFSTFMWFRSRHNAVGHHNVNDDWGRRQDRRPQRHRQRVRQVSDREPRPP